MKAYNYLLFRIYSELRNPKNGNNSRTIVVLLTSTSSFLLYFTFISIISIFDFYYDGLYDRIFFDKSVIIFFLIMISLLNYFIFIKNKNFLNFNFKSNLFGTILIIIYILFISGILIFSANKNRDKIYKEREKTRIENKI